MIRVSEFYGIYKPPAKIRASAVSADSSQAFLNNYQM